MAIEGIGERPDLVRPVEKIAQTHNNRSPQQNEHSAKKEQNNNEDEEESDSPFQKALKKAREGGGWVG